MVGDDAGRLQVGELDEGRGRVCLPRRDSPRHGAGEAARALVRQTPTTMASQIGISITTTGTTISTDLVPSDDPRPSGKRGLRSFSSLGAQFGAQRPPKALCGLPTRLARVCDCFPPAQSTRHPARHGHHERGLRPGEPMGLGNMCARRAPAGRQRLGLRYAHSLPVECVPADYAAAADRCPMMSSPRCSQDETHQNETHQDETLGADSAVGISRRRPCVRHDTGARIRYAHASLRLS